MSTYDEVEAIPDMAGKVVASAVRGQNDKCYDFLRIAFTDGTIYEATEGGQCGYIQQGWEK